MCTLPIQYGSFYLLGLKLDLSNNSLSDGKSSVSQNYGLIVESDYFDIYNGKQFKWKTNIFTKTIQCNLLHLAAELSENQQKQETWTIKVSQRNVDLEETCFKLERMLAASIISHLR